MRAVLLVVSLMMAGGCAGSSVWPMSGDNATLTDRGDEGLEISESSPISDVPLPTGFVTVRAVSSSSVDRRIRHVRHVYKGRATVDEMVAFYRGTLTPRGWRESDIGASAKLAVMTFTKGYEKLWIRIEKSWKALTITVVIDDRDLDTPPASPYAGHPTGEEKTE